MGGAAGVTNVKVLYFAVVRELVGIDEEALALPSAVTTVGAFAEWLEANREGLRGRMASIRIARNEAFAAASDPVAEGDVLALIPPVAGG
jgi:molybdopterin synthase sulfur carrier subunit